MNHQITRDLIALHMSAVADNPQFADEQADLLWEDIDATIAEQARLHAAAQRTTDIHAATRRVIEATAALIAFDSLVMSGTAWYWLANPSLGPLPLPVDTTLLVLGPFVFVWIWAIYW